MYTYNCRNENTYVSKINKTLKRASKNRLNYLKGLLFKISELKNEAFTFNIQNHQQINGFKEQI